MVATLWQPQGALFDLVNYYMYYNIESFENRIGMVHSNYILIQPRLTITLLVKSQKLVLEAILHVNCTTYIVWVGFPLGKMCHQADLTVFWTDVDVFKNPFSKSPNGKHG